MKVNNIFDIFGAIIFLALVAVVARNPTVLTGPLGSFNQILATAKQ
jgi:hypothetical protein